MEAAQTTGNHAYYWLVFIALAGVVISLYYYFGVIKAMYWSKDVKRSDGDRTLGTGESHGLGVHRGHLLAGTVPEHEF